MRRLPFGWWIDRDGWLWVAHDCSDGTDVFHPPNPTWMTTPDGPRPSFQCDKCGAHEVMSNEQQLDGAEQIMANKRADKPFRERLAQRMAEDAPLLQRLAKDRASGD